MVQAKAVELKKRGSDGKVATRTEPQATRVVATASLAQQAPQTPPVAVVDKQQRLGTPAARTAPSNRAESPPVKAKPRRDARHRTPTVKPVRIDWAPIIAMQLEMKSPSTPVVDLDKYPLVRDLQALIQAQPHCDGWQPDVVTTKATRETEQGYRERVLKPLVDSARVKREALLTCLEATANGRYNQYRQSNPQQLFTETLQAYAQALYVNRLAIEGLKKPTQTASTSELNRYLRQRLQLKAELLRTLLLASCVMCTKVGSTLTPYFNVPALSNHDWELSIASDLQETGLGQNFTALLVRNEKLVTRHANLIKYGSTKNKSKHGSLEKRKADLINTVLSQLQDKQVSLTEARRIIRLARKSAVMQEHRHSSFFHNWFNRSSRDWRNKSRKETRGEKCLRELEQALSEAQPGNGG